MENGIMNITQEDKDLLLRYLSMALPYGLKLKKCNEDNRAIELYSINLEHETIQYWNYKSSSLQIGGCGHLVRYDKLQFKPYLRPLSSMTEEEKKEYRKTQITKWVKSVDCTNGGYYEHRDTLKTFDWLNAHHFDYRGLIDKGLAIAASEGIYK